MTSASNRQELVDRLRYTFITADYDEIDALIAGLRQKANFESLCEEFFQGCQIDSRGSIVPKGFFTATPNSVTLLYAMYQLLGSAPYTFLLKHRVSRVRILRKDCKGHFKFPNGLFKLPNLKILIIRNMALKQLPAALSEVSNLCVLDLSGNMFTHFPDAILKLSRLSALNLSYNSIKVLPDSISRLKSLRIFSLQGNKVTKLPAEWHRLQFLRKLDLSMNRITTVPNSLLTIVSLQDIKLSYNDLPASTEAEWEKKIHEAEHRDGIQGSLELD